MASRVPQSPDASGRARRRYAPRMPPDQRREQLIDAALGVILAQGYSGVSIEAISRAAGVTRPVVYDHFPNLGQLLQALIAREEHYALEQLREILPEDPGAFEPIEMLIAGIRRFLHAVASRPATWRIILLPPEGNPAIVRQLVETNRARTLAQIEHLVQMTMTRPEIPDDLDVELTARTIRNLAEEAGRMVLTDPSRYSAERYERFTERTLSLLWPRDVGDR
jgi:AcrR family transcriptional regulator